MIQSKRFQFLDQETNVSISDFINANSSDILNTLRPLLLSVTPQLSALLNGLGFPDLEKEIGNLTNEALGGLTRLGKDALSSVTDLVGLTPKDIETFGQDLFSGIDGGLSAFKSLTDTAQQAIMMGASLYSDVNMFIQSGEQYIQGFGGDLQSVYGVTELLGRVTNGQFDPEIVDQFSLERMIGGLSYASFKTGLPGGFTAMANSVDNIQAVNNALVVLSGRMAREGNINALKEMAGVITNNALSQNVYQYIPDISTEIVTGYSIPVNTKELGLSDCFGDVNNTLDTFSPGWNTSRDNMVSSRHMATSSQQYQKVVEAKTYSHVPAIPDVNYAAPAMSPEQYWKAIGDYSKSRVNA